MKLNFKAVNSALLTSYISICKCSVHRKSQNHKCKVKILKKLAKFHIRIA